MEEDMRAGGGLLMASLPMASSAEYLAGQRDTICRKAGSFEDRLRESEPGIDAILDATGEYAIMIDRSFNVLWASKSAEERFGKTLLGKKCYQAYGRKSPCETGLCSAALTFADCGIHEHEIEAQDREGRKVMFRCVSNVVSKDEHGKPFTAVEILRELSECNCASNTTEWKRAQEALCQSEEKYRQLFNHAPAGIYEVDFIKGKLITVNDVMCEYMGYTKKEFLSLSPYDILVGESKTLFFERLRRMFAGEKVPETVELKIRAKTGREFWVLLNSKLLHADGMLKGATVVVHDITQRKLAEEALRQSEERLRSLSSELMKAQENERIRISKELHDEWGQCLALLKHRVRSIQKEFFDKSSSVHHGCQEAMQFVDEIIEGIRRLSRDLSPSILEDLGLSSALRWLAGNFAEQYSIPTAFDVDDIDGLFPQEAQRNLYRISQESLTNIGKHSDAGHVSFAVKKNERNVSFLVEDDGNGFDLAGLRERAPSLKGLGLTLMEERAHILGASFEVKSRVGGGTRIRLTIPYQKNFPLPQRLEERAG
jgi:PAS domain S-box-containing protein